MFLWKRCPPFRFNFSTPLIHHTTNSSHSRIFSMRRTALLVMIAIVYNTVVASVGQELGKGRNSYLTLEETDLGSDWLVSQNKGGSHADTRVAALNYDRSKSVTDC